MKRSIARAMVIAGVVLGSVGGVQAAALAHPYERIAYGLTSARCHSWGDNGERAGTWDDYQCSVRNPTGYELWVHYTH
jgi:hypothetical protein